MDSTVARKPWTAAELRRLPAGWRYEIDEGDLVIMSPAGRRHSRLAIRVAAILWHFVETHHLGEVDGGELGVFFGHDPETLRGIDVAFYSTERAKRLGDATGFVDVPPDLAVEVHDPSEPDLRRKVEQYLAAGVRSVWVLDPAAHTLTRHAPRETPQTWADRDALVVEPVLPGFSCRLRELLGESGEA